MMSYNTRRSGTFGAPATTPQQTVGSIGQRRPVSANFVAGGQQNKPSVQQMSAAQPQHLRTNQQQQQQQQQQAQSQPQNPGYRTQGYQTTVVQDVKPIIQGANPPNPAVDLDTSEPMDSSVEENQKRKPFWTRSGNKISKKEKMRRRNIRLSKMLQPKNAVMILNELVKNTSYMVEELPIKTEANQFKAAVLVEGLEHVGYGRSKIHAKNSAAESALKHLIKSNKLAEMKKDDEGNEKMDVSEDGVQPPLPWQHVASFALFKLFCSWGEDPNMVKTTKAQAQVINSDGTPKQHENKPAKKLPDNPETMNPLMLLNQMLPQAQFEEIGKSGSPPNVTYSFKCSVDGQSFMGTGANKKAAKKQAAFGVCHKVLNINYPPDVYTPLF